jgi:hypothetical protein
MGNSKIDKGTADQTSRHTWFTTLSRGVGKV